MSVLITGGAGFIGANFVLDWVAHSDEKIVNLDKLTYAGNLESLASLKNNPQHVFVQGDIGDVALLPQLLAELLLNVWRDIRNYWTKPNWG